MSSLYRAIVPFMFIGIMTGCKKNNDIAAPGPIMYKLVPEQGQYGTTVTIHGRYFSGNSGYTIRFNGVAGELLATTDTTITVKVPKGAGPGAITLIKGSDTVTGPEFNYEYKVSVATVAGPTNGQAGYVNGKENAVRFYSPMGIAIDNNDNVYISETGNKCIRKMDGQGNVTLLAGIPGTAGYLDAPVGTTAKFENPEGLCIDKDNNLYLVDRLNYRIRKITMSGSVSTVAGNGTAGYIDRPNALQAGINPGPFLSTDAAGNVYIANNSCSIRKIVPGGDISTIAGAANEGGYRDGQGSEARFYAPIGIRSDSLGNLYVVDKMNNRVRKISPSFYISTLAGNGLYYAADASTPLQASFNGPGDVALDKKGNILIGELGTGYLRMITPAGRVITLTKGGADAVVDGDGRMAKFGNILGIAVNSRNEIFIADAFHCIRKVVYE
jgi:hypothetical protein